MTVYILLAAAICILGLLISPWVSRSRAKAYLWLVFIMLLLISGLRAYSVGADTKAYVALFNNISSTSQLSLRFEIGFLKYLQFLHVISTDPRVMLFTSSAVCIGAACIFAYKFSKSPAMSMILYLLMGCYFSQMNVMRQALAMSLLEVAFILILVKQERVSRKVISALLILVATTIHTVAIVGLIPYVLILRDKGTDASTSDTIAEEGRHFTAQKMLGVTFIIGAAVFVGYSIVMLVVARVFPAYAHYFYGTWSDSNYNASLFNTLIQVVFAVAGTIVFRNKPLDRIQRFAAVMLSLSIIFNVLAMRMEIWGRIAGMFSIYTYLLWAPEFISEISSARNRYILNITISLCAFAYMLIVLIYRPEWTLVVPYLLR